MLYSPEFAAAQERLEALGKLSSGWDGYKSPPPSDSVVASARRLLDKTHSMGAPAPSVGPVPGGGIQIEWHTANAELELEVLPDARVVYLAVDTAGKENEGRLDLDDARCLFGLVQPLSRR